MIEPASLLSRWNVSAASVQRLGGTNNLSWRIESPAGTYVLRVYQNEGNLPHVAYEHELLLRLCTMGLSFAVPAPLRSRHDLTLEPVEVAVRVHASLFPLIRGRHPVPGDAHEARLAGSALGELDQALSRVNLPASDEIFPNHLYLERVHPLVSDPQSAILELDVEPALRTSYWEMVMRARAAGAHLYRVLPCQIIHNDIARSNMLVDDGRIAGILDFEFASLDLRALDLAVGLHMFASDWSSRSFSIDLTVSRAFAAGYREWVELSPDEIAGIPDLLRLRSAVSVIHRLGRKRSGLASTEDVASRMREALRLDTWLRNRELDLLESIGSR